MMWRRFIFVSMLVTGFVTGARCGAIAAEPTLGEKIALARFEEIRTIAGMTPGLYEGFDPLAYPSIIHQPGAWAVASGFEAAPPGFVPFDPDPNADVTLYHAPAGSFTHTGGSPALIAGRWTIVSRFDPPEPLPSGAHLGRRTAELGIAEFVADSFLVYAMEKRGASSPHPPAAGPYPESAEMIALTAVEQRLLMRLIRMRKTEVEIEQYLRHSRQLVSVRRARYRILGEELAGQEQLVERLEGMRADIGGIIPRGYMMGLGSEAPISAVDPSYQQFGNSVMLRLLTSNRAMLFTPDGPDQSSDQIALRGASLMFILDRFPGEVWRPRVLAGENPIDLLAEFSSFDDSDAAEAQALLSKAKETFFYDAAVALARADLEVLGARRARMIEDLFPPGEGRVTIRLGNQPDTYEETPRTAGWAGGGRVVHPDRVLVAGDGFRLEAGDGRGEEGVRVMTVSRGSRAGVTEVVISPVRAGALLPSERARPGSGPRTIPVGDPLTFEADGLKLSVSRGNIGIDATGQILIEIPKMQKIPPPASGN